MNRAAQSLLFLAFFSLALALCDLGEWGLLLLQTVPDPTDLQRVQVHAFGHLILSAALRLLSWFLPTRASSS